jgi:hypothetical protein
MHFKNEELSNFRNSIRAQLPGITVVPMLNQGFPRNLGVLSFGCPFLLLFWASKKVNK